jgi:hypothetical protein
MGYAIQGKYVFMLGVALALGPGMLLKDLLTGNTIIVQQMRTAAGGT